MTQSERGLLRIVTKFLIDDEWLLQGFWFNLLTTLGCVHSMIFGTFHMNFYMARGLTALEVAAVHSLFSIWNPLNDIFAGFLVDEWVARGFGSRLLLSFWAHAGYAGCTFFAFQENVSMPVWCQYAIAITCSDGFAAIAGAVNGLILIEQTKEDRQRIQIQRLNSIFGCLEWLVMSVAFWLWDSRPGHCGVFRMYLSLVCLGSALTTLVAVRRLHQPAKHLKHGKSLRTETMWQRLQHFLRLVRKHQNFWRYASLTAALEAEGVFFRQFDVVLIRLLLSSWMAAGKILLVISDPLCGTLSFALTWVAERPDMGVYKVSLAAIRVRTFVSVAACCFLLTLNFIDFSDSFYLNASVAFVLCLLMMICRAATRPASNLGGIVFASVIQEHSLVAEETQSEIRDEDDAGKYWMLRAALVKPLNSLGPVIGSAVLAAGGYTQENEKNNANTEDINVSSNLWWTCAWLPCAALKNSLNALDSEFLFLFFFVKFFPFLNQQFHLLNPQPSSIFKHLRRRFDNITPKKLSCLKSLNFGDSSSYTLRGCHWLSPWWRYNHGRTSHSMVQDWKEQKDCHEDQKSNFCNEKMKKCTHSMMAVSCPPDSYSYPSFQFVMFVQFPYLAMQSCFSVWTCSTWTLLLLLPNRGATVVAF